MPTRTPKAGSGLFQWNAGGWFGAQIGGTAWMVLLGATMIQREPGLGALLLVMALLLNGLGLWLWLQRDRYEPYPCIQGMIAAVGLVTFLLLWVFDASRHLVDIDPHFRDNPRGLYMVLLMFPALMGLFHFQNRIRRG